MHSAVQLANDELTGLFSRRSLISYLDGLERVEPIECALVSVQITRFGHVNSSLGGLLGDKVILSVAKRLTKTFPDALLLARTHGDNFALVLGDVAMLERELDRLCDFLQRPFLISGEIIVLSLRVGIAKSIDLDNNYSRLLQASEVALQKAKSTSQQRVFYEYELLLEVQRRQQLENELRVSLVNRHSQLHRALHNNEFLIYYQPIINTRLARVEGCEALLRWIHPKRGLISPMQFIPMAEQLQLMDVLGSWVLKRAIADAESWSEPENDYFPSISINVSPTQFINAELLLNSLTTALGDTSLPASNIKIEVTESSAFAESMKSCLEQIRALGCKVALDDFGTGFSSLTQLNLLPIDYLKLDRSFVKELDSDNKTIATRSKRMTMAGLALADTFGLIPIIEGIENKAQLDQVLAMGANLIQGYYFSKPVPHDEIAATIQRLNGAIDE